MQTIKNIVRDQGEIWTSPAHVRLGHADWLVPYVGLTAGFLVTDRDASLHLSNSPSTLKHYRDFSNYGLAGMGAAVGGLYLWGRATNDAHKEEAGILSGEAAVNALLVTEALTYSFGRQRPTVDAAHGKFWQGGDSFPSGHPAISWPLPASFRTNTLACSQRFSLTGLPPQFPSPEWKVKVTSLRMLW